MVIITFHTTDRDFDLSLTGLRKQPKQHYLQFIFLFLNHGLDSFNITSEKIWTKKLFQSMWKKEILNVIAVYFSKNDDLKAVTYNPFKDDYFIELDIENTKKLEVFFPDKLVNLNNTNVLVGMIPDKIRFILNKQNIYNSTGLDFKLIKYLRSGLNAKFTILNMKHQSKLNNSKDFDILMTSILMTADFVKEYNLEPSNPVAAEDLLCLVPNSEPASQFGNLFYVYNYKVWTGIGVTLVISALAWKLIEKLSRVEKTAPHLLYLIRSITFQSMSYANNKKLSAQIFFGSWIAYSLIISSGFCGALVSKLMQTAKLPQINTLQELAKSNLSIVTEQQFFKMLNYSFCQNNTAHLNLTRKLILMNTTRQFERFLKTTNGSYAFIHRDLEAVLYVNEKIDGKLKYHLMGEPIVSTYVTFAAQIGSYLMPAINAYIRNARETGLFEKWMKISLLDVGSDLAVSNLTTHDNRTATEEKRTDVPLNIQNLQVAFYLVILGNIFGAIAFIGELVYFRIDKKFKRNSK